jgi:hypothetical protein
MGREWDNQNLVLEQTKETTNFIPYLKRSYWIDLVSSLVILRSSGNLLKNYTSLKVVIPLENFIYKHTVDSKNVQRHKKKKGELKDIKLTQIRCQKGYRWSSFK